MFICAETEKYAHVTFFFNGGVEQAWPGEDRVMVPSPKVSTYDLQPEMNASGVAKEVESSYLAVCLPWVETQAVFTVYTLYVETLEA